MACASKLDQQLLPQAVPRGKLPDQTVDRMGGLKGTETMPLASASVPESEGTEDWGAVTGGAQIPTAAWP
jgi:hypothetical protein